MRTMAILSISVTVLSMIFLFQPTSLQTAHQATPTPSLTIPQMTIALTLQENKPPTYQIFSDEALQPQTLHFSPTMLHLTLPLSQSNHLFSLPQSQAGVNKMSFIDNWELLFNETFETNFPQSPCTVFDSSDDGFERFWGDDNFKAFTGDWAGWPANEGQDGLEPELNDYPANLQSWLRCGPFDLRNAEKFLIKYARWLEINDPDDTLFVGVSQDGYTYSGLNTSGISDWTAVNLYVNGVVGSLSLQTEQVDVPWSFGLYYPGKKDPKPSQCAFRAYPKPCSYIFIPEVLK